MKQITLIFISLTLLLSFAAYSADWGGEVKCVQIKSGQKAQAQGRIDVSSSVDEESIVELNLDKLKLYSSKGKLVISEKGMFSGEVIYTSPLSSRLEPMYENSKIREVQLNFSDRESLLEIKTNDETVYKMKCSVLRD